MKLRGKKEGGTWRGTSGGMTQHRGVGIASHYTPEAGARAQHTLGFRSDEHRCLLSFVAVKFKFL